MVPDPRLTRLLERAFDEMNGEDKKTLSAEEYARRRFDFAFHMTDWLADLDWLASVYKNPDAENPKAVEKKLIGFLYHVIPHLRAAGRVFLGEEVSDPFKNDYKRGEKKVARPRVKTKSKS